MPNFAYRPEIDGMRAIAVGSVVLFHMGLPFVGGGFAGVDVFFVISGFLITSLIDAEMREKRFSFAAFYERRIRRLLPPLIPVILCTWALSYALLNVWQFADFARSLRATLALSANWHFFSTVGYFDGPTETKPLLHFWSLAVEEQFYLVFPALLLLLWRLVPHRRAAATIALGMTSLGLNAYLVVMGKSDSTFFNSFARFWEIFAGAALALLPIRIASRLLATVLEALGLAILTLLFAWPDAALFPSQSAAVAVLGALLLIMGNGEGSLVSPLLKSQPFVAIGKISYALYLWHWPIIVALRMAYPDVGFGALAAGMGIAVALSVLSYWMLERPFRTRRFLPRRRSVFALFVLATLSFGALSVANYLPATSGLKASLSVAVRGLLYGQEIGTALFTLDAAGGNVSRYDVYFDGNSPPFDAVRHTGLPCSFDNGNTPDRILECLAGQAKDKNVLLVGDSIGRDTLHALRSGFPDVNFLMLHQSSCPAADARVDGAHCFPGLEKTIDDFARRASLDVVVLAYRYLPQNWASVGPTLDAAAATGAKTALLGLSPVFMRTISQLLRSLPPDSAFPLSVSKTDDSMIGWDMDAMAVSARVLANAHHAQFINVLLHFCPGTKCPLWLDNDTSRPIFWDAQHLTEKAIVAFGSYLASQPEMRALLAL